MPEEAETPPADGQGPPADESVEEQEGQEAEGQDLEADSQPSPQIRRLRDENAKWRTKLRETETKLKKLLDEKLTDEERKAQRTQELESQVSEMAGELRTLKIEKVAARAGAKSPDLVARLVSADVEEDGWERSVGQLKKHHPELFGTPGGAGGSGNGGAGGQAPPAMDMNALFRQAAGRGP